MGTSTRPGDVLAGRYRLIDLLSESSGGRFWRAHDAVLERYVALHVIAEDDPRAESLVAAARSSAMVLDPRILRVLDAEVKEGRCFVVNEWGTGTSLDILVTNAGPLSPRSAAWLVADVADAVARAHEAGVTHGRLNPENVLIDRLGAVHLIGMCVDAALHGLPPARPAQDQADLGGILHCALTGTWPGPSTSVVTATHRVHGVVLSPRQVTAGVPRPLDLIWREIEMSTSHRSQRVRPRRLPSIEHPDVSTAQAIAERLGEFLGDTTGLADRLAASILPINQVRPVSLPALTDPPPREPEPAPDPDAAPDAAPERRIPTVAEIPTEAGLPVFGEDDDVTWMRARATPPAPPPPFEDLPERPLFAPEQPEPAAVRRARASVPAPPTPDQIAARTSRTAGPGDFWPWDTDHGPAPEDQQATGDLETVPGRSWLRLAFVVGLAVLLLVAVAMAFNLGRGRSPLGEERSGPTPGGSPAASVAPRLVPDVKVRDFDPLGNGTEYPEDVGNTVDGDPTTTWDTQTYTDQLGPDGLKSGLGLILDLGSQRTVTDVELTLVGAPTTASVWVTQSAPQKAPGPGALVTATATGRRMVLAPGADQIAQGATTGRFVLIWFTRLPPVSGGFRGEVAEVTVHGH